MKLTANATMEVGLVRLDGIKIGEKTYSLQAVQCGSNGKQLQLTFSDAKTDGAYIIFIDERGLSLRREILRPQHDHSNFDTLKEFGTHDPWFSWIDDERTRSDENGSVAFLEFGPRSVDW